MIHRIIATFLLIGFLGIGFVPIAEAQNPFKDGLRDAQNTATTGGISGSTDVLQVISSVIKWLLALSAVLAMAALVWGGIMYILSLGDEGRAGKAKQIIMYAIIGVIVVLLSYVIIVFVQTLLTASAGQPLPGIATAHAIGLPRVPPSSGGSSTDKGFMSGLSAIVNLVKPAESGLATDPTISAVILRIVRLLLNLVAVLALAALVWGSIMYIVSLGDESRVEKAKKIITYAIIGVFLTGLSFVILTVIQGIIAGP